MTDQSLSGLEALGAFATTLHVDRLPSEVVRRAQACLLYGLAVGVASREASTSTMATAIVTQEYGSLASGLATCLLDGRNVSPGAAAFANATLMHARVQEDAHPAGHVGVVVVPAALAMAQHCQASGAELLTSIVAGYEVALRIGRDHAADASERGFRTTPLYGVFGAAAAGSHLLKLEQPRMVSALAFAANMAAGLREFVHAGTEEFPFHAGFAARNGLLAAQCGQVGALAAATTLEGIAGFYRSYGGVTQSYGARITEHLNHAFELDQITYKPYPTCQFNRSVIRGVLELREQLLGKTLESIVLEMHPFEADFIGMRYVGPFRQFAQTFMSAPFCAALAWCHGSVTYQGMHGFTDQEVLNVARLIELRSNPAISRYQPHICLKTSEGDTVVWKETPDTQRYALTWDAACDMAGRLMREVGVTDALIEALIVEVNALPTAQSVVGVVSAANRAMMRSHL